MYSEETLELLDDFATGKVDSSSQPQTSGERKCDCGLTLEVAVRGEERITSITLEIGKYRDFYHQEPRRSVLLGTEPLDSPEGVSADILTRQYRSFGQEGTYICARSTRHINSTENFSLLAFIVSCPSASWHLLVKTCLG